jgi:hypothetical protein
MPPHTDWLLLGAVAAVCGGGWLLITQGGVRGVRDGWWRLRPKGATDWDSPGAGRIELRVQYRPYHT